MKLLAAGQTTLKPLVYLAGPIAGMSSEAATLWRYDAEEWFQALGIEALDPMRGKHFHSHISRDFDDYKDAGVFYTSKAIMTRDYNDVLRSDALLVNLLEMRLPSLGTVMELAWAWQLRKPCVVVMEPEGNPHDKHPMLLETFSFRVASLSEGLFAVSTVLNR